MGTIKSTNKKGRTLLSISPLLLIFLFFYKFKNEIFYTYFSDPFQQLTIIVFSLFQVILSIFFLKNLSQRFNWLLFFTWGIIANLFAYNTFYPTTTFLQLKADYLVIFIFLTLGLFLYPSILNLIISKKKAGFSFIAFSFLFTIPLLTTTTKSYHFRNLSEDSLLRSKIKKISQAHPNNESQKALAIWKHISNNIEHKPGSVYRSPDQIYKDKTGVCGSASKLLNHAFHLAQIPSRIINIEREISGGHVVVEAFIKNKWRMYDADIKILQPSEINPLSVLELIKRKDKNITDGLYINAIFQILTINGLYPFHQNKEAIYYKAPSKYQ